MRSNLRWCSRRLRVHLLERRGRPRRLRHRRARPRGHRLARGRERRDQRLGHPGHDARSRGGPLRRHPRAASGRDAHRQRLGLHRPRDPHLRPPARPQALLHARARARRATASPRPSSTPSSATTSRSRPCQTPPPSLAIDRRLVRRLQRQPPALRAQDALASRVHRSPNRNRLSVRSTAPGSLSLKLEAVPPTAPAASGASRTHAAPTTSRDPSRDLLAHVPRPGDRVVTFSAK